MEIKRMKRQLLLIFLLTCTIIAGIALGSIIKETKQGESIEFFTNESGTVEKTAELTPAGVLKVDNVRDLAGTGTPPGMIPIGGMVAVMPNVSGAWQPPATEVVKDGFMRADGKAVTDVDSPMVGQNLPNMVDMFTRGSASSGTQSGSNSITPTGTVSQPTLAGNAESRANWFKNQAISATFAGDADTPTGTNTGSAFVGNPVTPTGTNTLSAFVGDAAIRTDWFGGNSLLVATAGGHSLAFAHTHVSITTGSSAGHLYQVKLISDTSSTSTNGGSSGQLFRAVYWDNDYTGGTYTTVSSSTHNKPQMPLGVGVSGTKAFTSGAVNSSGNSMTTLSAASTSVTFDADNNTKNDWAATGSYTPTGTMTQPTFTGNPLTPTGTVTFNPNNDNMSDWATAGSYTPTGTVSQPTFTGNSQTNMPVYTTVVWVIRIK